MFATATSLENSGNTGNTRLVEDFSTNITSILHQIWKGIISDNLWKQAYTLDPYLTVSSNNHIPNLRQRFVCSILAVPYILSDIRFKLLSYPPIWDYFSIDWEEKTIRFTFLDNIIIRNAKISNKSRYRMHNKIWILSAYMPLESILVHRHTIIGWTV